MASSCTVALVALVMMLIALPTITFAEDFMVGDGAGWTVGFDYQAWAATKQYHVGDRLVFQYPVGAHNVYKVNGTDFTKCSVPVQGIPFNSGKDTIALSTPGNKWYICGVEGHCLGGQKLKITVLANAQALPPSAAGAPPSRGQLPWIIPVPARAPSVQLPWTRLVPAPAPAPSSSSSQAMDYETAAN